MQFLFWLPVYEGCADYLIHNYPLQDLSHNLPVLFVGSGDDTIPEILKLHYGDRAHYLSVALNSMILKARLAWAYAADASIKCDWLVKIDADALLMNFKQLEEVAQRQHQSKPVFVGNLCYRNASFYVRGGMQMCNKPLLRNIVFKPKKYHPFKLDAFLTESVRKAFGDEGFVHDQLFEMKARYRGIAPAWHPPKTKKRMQLFLQRGEEYCISFREPNVKAFRQNEWSL